MTGTQHDHRAGEVAYTGTASEAAAAAAAGIAELDISVQQVEEEA
jgi:hypothetical protein